MSSLPKLSLILLALGILSAPFFANAAWGFSDGATGSSFQIPSLSNFSLKDIDSRIYARLEGEGEKITQTAGHLCERRCLISSPWGGCLYRYTFCPAQCSDGHNNDTDSFTDYPNDLGCTGTGDWSESPNPQCSDGSDNDGDGAIDYPADLGCTDASDTSERGTLACDNGIDDDGDGSSDYPDDPGCSSPPDTSELGTLQCDDGVDNDRVLGYPPRPSDGIDYKPGALLGGDPDCESPSDNVECGNDSNCRGGGIIEVPQQAFSPSVDLYLDNNPSVNSHTLVGNAYNTSDRIYWNVKDSCAAGCTSTPSNWWNGTLDGSGDGTGYVDNISILVPNEVTYALTCGVLPCTSPNTNYNSVTVTPQWSPSFSFSGPARVNTNEHVNLIWSGNDIKSCSASGWSGPSTSALQVSNTLQNQDHSVDVGTISADKTFYLNCTGYNDVVLSQKTWTVDLITSPTPYFFINSINLIIIGPGSGGRSNKATIGVTPGGGFTGTINLSAANGALTSAGAVLHVEPSTITCDGVSCTTAEFWVETAGDLAEPVYTITLTADPVPSGFESKTQDISLRVRRFVPAFEEI